MQQISALQRGCKAKGAIAFFGEKYGDIVRLVNVDEFSKELCGGIHVKQTGEIGLFKIVSESSVAAGIRRIEAVTGEEGIRYIHGKDDVLNEVLSILKTTPKDLVWRMNKLIQTQKQIEKELERLKTEGGRTAIDSNDR